MNKDKDIDPAALARLVLLVLWRTARIPGDPEEKEDIAVSEIVKKLEDFLPTKIIGLDPKGLTASETESAQEALTTS